MKNVATFIVIVLFSAIGYSQNGPKIEFSAPDNTVDYGKISKSDNGVRSFEFTNTGDAPLLITSAESTVSTIVVTKPAAAIMPGKKGKITLSFYSSNFDGAVNKYADVFANVENAPVKLTFNANVQP